MTRQFKKKLFCLLAVFSYITGACTGGGVLADKYQPSHLEILENLSSNAKQEAGSKASDFTDISQNDWFYPYIDALCEDGIVNGISSTSFAPERTFSYAEGCAVIVRYLGLEDEAKQRQSVLAENSKQGHGEWYSGYIQLLYETGVLRTGTALFTQDENGLCSINTSVAVSPVKRYEFADMVSRSFELADSEIKAKNNYFEISGNASEFISTGFYDSEAVLSYAKVIADFESIPAECRESVLKAYYNGIFCGNQFGEFLPDNNLTRAEMAKVIATATDFSLRVWAQNESGIKQLSESDFETDASGSTYIKKSSARSILERIAGDITVSNGDLSYIRESTAPNGYSTDLYVYSSNGGKQYTLIGESSLHVQTKNAGKDIFCWYGEAGKVLIVLRNLTENSRPEAVMEMVLSKNGVVETTFAEYAPVAFEKAPQNF